MGISLHCLITLILLDSLTIVLADPSTLTLLDTLRIIAVVGTAVFLLSVRLDVVLAEEGRVAMPLAQLLSDNSSLIMIIAVEAEALPAVTFLMRLGRTLTNHLSTSP